MVTARHLFAISEPYLLVTLCAARLIPCPTKRLQGGKNCSAELDAAGYRIAVTWPWTFFNDLNDARTRAGVARLLLTLAEQRWHRWANPYSLKSGWIGRNNERGERQKKILQWLAQTTAIVRRSNCCWRGSLYEIYQRARFFRLPLLDALEGGEISRTCDVCRHEQRFLIDGEIRTAAKTLSQIGREYGLRYSHLLWHVGRRTISSFSVRRKRSKEGRWVRGHVNDSPPAEMRWVQQQFFCGRLNDRRLAQLLLNTLGVKEDGFQGVAVANVN
jgi:hypothetical protein